MVETLGIRGGGLLGGVTLRLLSGVPSGLLGLGPGLIDLIVSILFVNFKLYTNYNKKPIIVLRKTSF